MVIVYSLPPPYMPNSRLFPESPRSFFHRTRDHGTQLALNISPNRLEKPHRHFFYFIRLEMIQFFPTDRADEPSGITRQKLNRFFK